VPRFAGLRGKCVELGAPKADMQRNTTCQPSPRCCSWPRPGSGLHVLARPLTCRYLLCPVTAVLVRRRFRRCRVAGAPAGVRLLRGSFIPPADIKAARDVIRYRARVVQSRTSEVQRLGNVLQDAGIKIDPVASSIASNLAHRGPRLGGWVILAIWPASPDAPPWT
jgi:hypothetical protein